MDSDTLETFFGFGSRNRFDNSVDFDEWRTAVTNADDADVADVSRYTERVDQAADRDDIDNLEDILDDTTPSTDAFAGESGEAASAVRYANQGAEVEIEPGNGDYDLSVTGDGQTEYVEVKTRAEDDIDYNYVNGRISEMNKKYNNARNDPDIDLSNSDRILEIRTRSESTELSAARSTVERVIDDRVNVPVDEIRLVPESGDPIYINI